ncbi:MAG: hypothetical protein KA419_12725 [Acidobacteria bacterium]|nr:hypothetical protein [Acidobacteriota bacterium]
MAMRAQNDLFSWDFIEEMEDIKRTRLVLENLPDEGLVRTLESRRGQGRNDYPVRPIPLKLLPGRGNEGLCCDQDGRLYCWREDVDSGKSGHYPMSLKGCEADRDSLKYLCPAEAKGFS